MAQNRPGGVFSSLRMGGKTALETQHALLLPLRLDRLFASHSRPNTG